MGLEKKLTGEWVDFDGDYEKTVQDIELYDGLVINKCWPNAGTFNCLSSTIIEPVPYSKVKRVRKCLEAYTRLTTHHLTGHAKGKGNFDSDDRNKTD